MAINNTAILTLVSFIQIDQLTLSPSVLLITEFLILLIFREFLGGQLNEEL